MNLLNNDPNFSIVLPGGCNASCDFCFTGNRPQRTTLSKYLINLSKTLESLPEEFYQISLTGGEPCISPWFEHVLDLISNYREKYTNILLTTNGTNLLENKDIICKAVDHINISRHHYNHLENKKIFKGTYNISDDYIQKCIDEFGKEGIDVSVNCVVNDSTTKQFIEKFIDYSKGIGFSAIRFRKENGTNDPVPVENEYSDYKIVWNGECPVCRTRKRIIKGMDVFWKTSVVEPDDVSGNKLFELVYMEDGNVYSDWNNKNKIDVKNIKNTKKTELTMLDRMLEQLRETKHFYSDTKNVRSGYLASGRFRCDESSTACGGSSRSSRSSCGGSSGNSCGGSSSSRC